MAFAQKGLPQPADLLTVLDSMGAWFKRAVDIGVGADTETTTLGHYSRIAETNLLGDGSGVPGIANSDLKARLQDSFSNVRKRTRYDLLTQTLWGDAIRTIEGYIRENMPRYYDPDTGVQTVWNFGNANLQVLDAFLSRLNATNPNNPLAPTGTPTLTPATGGNIPSCSAPNGPLFCYTFVGTSDERESLPSATATQVALTGPYTAYTLGAIQNPIPAGVRKIRLYRSPVAGSTKYYLRDVAVTAGAVPPTITLTEADMFLTQTVQPPSWAQLLAGPEDAAVYMLAYATLLQAAAFQNLSVLPQFSGNSVSMLSPWNVVVNPVYILSATPSYNFLGVNNTPASALFAQWVATVFTAGVVQATNVPSQAVQGFFGAYGAQARVVSALNGSNATVGISYTYNDASNPITPQSATSTPVSIAGTVDTVADLSIPAGRIVRTVTAINMGNSGGSTPTTGTLVIEGKTVRSL